MANKVLPIKAKEIVKVRQANIPDEVFEVFNQIIAKTFSGSSAIVKQPEVIKQLVAKGFKANDIFEKHWLDVEGVYRKAGWKVEYDKPAYNESYDAYFVFSTKRK